MSKDIRLACCLSDAELRKHVAMLVARFESAVLATEELADGYGFGVPGDKKWMALLWDAIVAERECCPFLTFELTARPNMGPVSVRVTGPAGTKEFLKTILSRSMDGRQEQKMPQITPAEFYALPLRVHTLLADVPLHDVWAVDLPAHRDGITLSEFLRRTSQCGLDTSDAEINRLPPAARALFRLRFFLGRIFRLEAEPKGALAASFGSRLTAEDRAHSSVASGTPEGLFRVVYRFENEQLLEIQNRTVHGAALSALAERPDGYRFYFAVYVRQTTWITPFYMGLIDPFRKWIIYPALLKKIRATWDRNI